MTLKAKEKIQRFLCLFGFHEWHWLESMYAGEFNGKWCEWCNKEVGERNV